MTPKQRYQRVAMVGAVLCLALISNPKATAQTEQTPTKNDDKTAVKPHTDAAIEAPTKQDNQPRKIHGLFDPSYKFMTGDWGGVRLDLEKHGFKFSLAYQQQAFVNLHGGVSAEQGFRQAGSYDLVLKTDFGKMGLWKGGYGYIKTKGHWREALGINKGKIGGLSKVNADEGEDDPVFVSKWWIGQKFLDGKIDMRIGRLESKKDLFDRNDYARNEDYMFINSWFRRTANVPHTTAGGAWIKIRPNDWFYFQMGVFDGTSRGSKRGLIRTTFHGPDRFLGMWEAVFSPKFKTARGTLGGNYRFGLWYDGRPRTIFQDTSDDARALRTKSNNIGYYFSFDQFVFKENDDPQDKQGLGLFFRFGHAKEEVEKIENFWSFGAHYQGLIKGRNKDEIGLAVAQGIMSDQYRREVDQAADRETVYELYYQIRVTPWLAITPDLQYVQNPGGLETDRDAFVAGIRVRILF